MQYSTVFIMKHNNPREIQADFRKLGIDVLDPLNDQPYVGAGYVLHVGYGYSISYDSDIYPPIEVAELLARKFNIMVTTENGDDYQAVMPNGERFWVPETDDEDSETSLDFNDLIPV